MNKKFLCMLASMGIIMSMFGFNDLSLSANANTTAETYGLPRPQKYVVRREERYWWWDFIPPKKKFYINGGWHTLSLKSIMDGPSGPFQVKLAIYTGTIYEMVY